VPWCTDAQLTVTAGQENAGAGHIGFPVIFENISGQTCSLYGYPGVAGLNQAGEQADEAQRVPAGYLGGTVGAPPFVLLAPGQYGSALVQGTDNPVDGVTSCVSYSGLLVTPPNTTESTQLNIEMPGCSGLQVSPVVNGTTGLEQP
jgi:hypothetical protein